MAYADYDAYLVAKAAGFPAYSGYTGISAANIISQYRLNTSAQNVPAVPSTAEAVYANNIGNMFSVTSNVALVQYNYSNLAAPGGLVLFYDRLSHVGGFSGTNAIAQTAGLPTVALPRYATGAGVQIGIETSVAVGTTPASISASYTNQDGTSGRTTPSQLHGTAGYGATLNNFRWLPLQDGDTGARSVESITLSVSTGTAGNLAVVLFKPLFAMFLDTFRNVDYPTTFGSLPIIPSDACVCALMLAGVTSNLFNEYLLTPIT